MSLLDWRVIKFNITKEKKIDERESMMLKEILEILCSP